MRKDFSDPSRLAGQSYLQTHCCVYFCQGFVVRFCPHSFLSFAVSVLSAGLETKQNRTTIVLCCPFSSLVRLLCHGELLSPYLSHISPLCPDCCCLKRKVSACHRASFTWLPVMNNYSDGGRKKLPTVIITESLGPLSEEGPSWRVFEARMGKSSSKSQMWRTERRR